MSPSSLLSPPPCPSLAKPCPVSQSPLDFCHFSTLSRPFSRPPAQQLLFMLCHRFCLHFASSFASFSSLFFDNEKCSTRFSLLIYVLARFSYTLALICCCCCCCSFFFFFLCQLGSLPSFNFTCHCCICSFFLCIAVQFNEHFFMSFQLGAPICL